MDEDHCTRPVLMAKERTKYGRSDYERYDNITTDVGRAGRGKIGKVEVDCHFLFTKSRWGVIGSHKIPAGIIYMDLDFHQPSDCKLESATVAVTLTTEDGEECRLRPQARPEPGHVKFTQHFGPHEMRGKEIPMQTRRNKKWTPQFEIMGHGVGGMGLDKERLVQAASRWRFSGHTTSDGGGIWDNKLQWELQENKQEPEPTRPNRLHTAFAFEHNASRFYMTVTVSGKLAKWSNKFKTLLQIGKRKDGEPQEIVTKIEWVDGYNCPLLLDRHAQDLRLVMELENMSAVPIELPAAQVATFRPANSPSPSPSGPGLPGTQPVCLPSSTGTILGQEPERPTLQAIEWQPLQTEHDLGSPAQPTLEHLSQAAGFAPLQPPPPQARPSRPAVTRPLEEDPVQEAPASSSSSVVIQLPEPAQTNLDGQHNTNPPESAESEPPTVKIVPRPNPARPNVSAILFLIWLRNVSVEFLWMIAAMIPQAPAPEVTGKEHTPKPMTETQDGKETAWKETVTGGREQDRLRLSVPQQDTPKDLDGETCIGSSGLTPRTAFSTVEQRKPWPHHVI